MMQPDKKSSGGRKKIVLFSTGGTIGMVPNKKNRGVVPSADFQRFLYELHPNAEAYMQDVDISHVLWSNIPSPHMTPEKMFHLAQDIDAALNKPETFGVIVTHGTDVLVESAFMAHLVLQTKKPVIFTGSMRYFSESGYDGIRNLINSIKACLLPVPSQAGVFLMMNDRLFLAHEVVKMNALNVDAFDAPESGPVGYIAGEEVLLIRSCAEDSKQRCPLIQPENMNHTVPLITCYTGMKEEDLIHVENLNADGLVVEGFGAGNVPPGILPVLERLLNRPVPVVLTTQCPQGRAWPIYAYPGGGAELERKGVILGGRLSGAKARILLMAALGAKRSLSEIKQLFQRI